MHQAVAAPSFETRTLGRLVIAGVAGLIAWEVVARLITPLVIGGPLEPQGLIIGLFRNVLGFNPGFAGATLLHLLTGAVAYPIGYWIMTRPLPVPTGLVGGLLLGVGTWFLAMGIFATLAGLPFMLGFIPLTWMSLVGHVLLGLATAFTFEALTRRAA